MCCHGRSGNLREQKNAATAEIMPLGEEPQTGELEGQQHQHRDAVECQRQPGWSISDQCFYVAQQRKSGDALH